MVVEDDEGTREVGKDIGGEFCYSRWVGEGRIWGFAGGVPWHNWSPLRG